MPQIYSAQKVAGVWEMFQLNKTRQEIATFYNINLEDIDGYIFAAFKKYYTPKLVYKGSDRSRALSKSTLVIQGKLFERPKAEYSNPDYTK